MSHMLCICGHDIADHTDLLPYAGFAYVIRDQNRDQFLDDVYQDLASFATALAVNGHVIWISGTSGEWGWERHAACSTR